MFSAGSCVLLSVVNVSGLFSVLLLLVNHGVIVVILVAIVGSVDLTLFRVVTVL